MKLFLLLMSLFFTTTTFAAKPIVYKEVVRTYSKPTMVLKQQVIGWKNVRQMVLKPVLIDKGKPVTAPTNKTDINVVVKLVNRDGKVITNAKPYQNLELTLSLMYPGLYLYKNENHTGAGISYTLTRTQRPASVPLPASLSLITSGLLGILMLNLAVFKRKEIF